MRDIIYQDVDAFCNVRHNDIEKRSENRNSRYPCGDYCKNPFKNSSGFCFFNKRKMFFKKHKGAVEEICKNKSESERAENILCAVPDSFQLTEVF